MRNSPCINTCTAWDSKRAPGGGKTQNSHLKMLIRGFENPSMQKEAFLTTLVFHMPLNHLQGRALGNSKSQWFVLRRHRSGDKMTLHTHNFPLFNNHWSRIHRTKATQLWRKIWKLCLEAEPLLGPWTHRAVFISFSLSFFIFKRKWNMCLLVFPVDVHLLRVIFHMTLKHNALRSALDRQLGRAGSCSGPQTKKKILKFTSMGWLDWKQLLKRCTVCLSTTFFVI